MVLYYCAYCMWMYCNGTVHMICGVKPPPPLPQPQTPTPPLHQSLDPHPSTPTTPKPPPHHSHNPYITTSIIPTLPFLYPLSHYKNVAALLLLLTDGGPPTSYLLPPLHIHMPLESDPPAQPESVPEYAPSVHVTVPVGVPLVPEGQLYDEQFPLPLLPAVGQPVAE